MVNSIVDKFPIIDCLYVRAENMSVSGPLSPQTKSVSHSLSDILAMMYIL